ncbi:mitochondrial inner membrane protease subunit 2 isoform X3 [Ursus arctos]|uniref:mitochondrial inner membrane protease subunit 2 isoform X3 n=1 Tax=Ursus arctos TaxID=9644 RepID=UPI001CF8CCBA|nr:mitochondrial inner membrane protease subunit 2 isoform X3 [Ursus arctos]
MAQSQGWVRRYAKAFCKGFFVAVPVAVTFLDRVACVARVEGASMQPSLNPGGSQSSDVVLLNHWKVRNFEVQRGDIVSLVSPKNPEQKIIKRVIALEGDIVKTMGHKNRYVKVPRGHIWVEGDHHGHSFDSNSFGPRKMRRLTQARWLQRSASEAPRAALYTWMDVSRITHVQVLSVEIIMFP